MAAENRFPMTASLLEQIAKECETTGLTAETGRRMAMVLAKTFQVKEDEVGILRLEKDSLVFVYPERLHKVGRIPLKSPASLAAHTAHGRRAEINNDFSRARHSSFFETFDVAAPPEGKKRAREELIIQKIMSAPVIRMNAVAGVIQVCRKGPTIAKAGPDFTQADLQKLIAAATTLAACFMEK
jgi:hypothetical protein